jgi:hypothetical protein
MPDGRNILGLDLGGSGNENEVLFKPGSKFQVLQRFDATNIDDAAGPYVFPNTMPALPLQNPPAVGESLCGLPCSYPKDVGLL